VKHTIKVGKAELTISDERLVRHINRMRSWLADIDAGPLSRRQPLALSLEVVGEKAVDRAVRPAVRLQPVVAKTQLGAEADKANILHHCLICRAVEDDTGREACCRRGSPLFEEVRERGPFHERESLFC